MATELPRITIVTPVFNGAKYIAETLASVRAQNYPNLEYIVCDGGSTDGTLEILQANRDIISQLITGRDKGMYDALMKGFVHATGTIYGWINADDILMPWCLKCVAHYLASFPDSCWLTGIPSIIDEQSRLLWVSSVTPCYRRSWIRRGWYSAIGLGIIQQECTFFTKDLFLEAGGLNPSLKLAGDFDLWRRMAKNADLHQTGTVLAAFRMHSTNLSKDQAGYLDEARAVKIPGGKIWGYSYSFLAFLLARLRQQPRLVDNLTGK